MRNPELLEQQLRRVLDDKTKARKHFRQLADLISFQDLSDNGVPELGRKDVCDPYIANEVARMTLRKFGVPDEEIRFSKIEILPLDDFRFAIATDINFERLRQFLSEADRASFSADQLFPAVSDARLDIGIAASQNSAFVGNEGNQAIVAMILQRSLGSSFDPEKSKREIYDYISVATPSVREIVNSGQRTPSDFAKLLEKAGPFQRWINQQNPNADLVKEMLLEKAKTDWLDSLPVKTMRFGLFTGGGFLADLFAPGTSAALGAVDNFLVDKVKKNWRPHYFIENHLKGFLEKGIENTP